MEETESYTALGIASRWYSTLRPLRLDLVGDFADGPEVFHAVYVLEKFLANLKSRGCNFHILFFENRKFLCFNHKRVAVGHAWRYILIREAFIRHLQQNLAHDNPVKIHLLKDVADPAFENYLEENKPYFCMAHDVTAGAGKGREQHLLQAGFLWWVMNNGFNVALLDQMEFRDSKAITIVAEGHGLNKFPEGFETAYHKETARVVKSLEGRYEFGGDDLFFELSEEAEEFINTPREYLIVVALSMMDQEDYQLSTLVENLGFAFLQQALLLSSLTLEERVVAEVELEDGDLKVADLEDFLNELCRFLAMILNGESDLKPLEQSHPGMDFEACDIIDARLFKFCLANPSFAESVKGDAERLARAFEAHTSTKLTPREHLFVCKTSPKPQTQARHVSVLPFQHKAFDEHLSVVKLEIDKSGSPERAMLHRLAPERTHWHTTSLLRGEFKIRNKWQNRSEQIYQSQMQRYAASLTGKIGQSLDPELIIVDEKSGKGRLLTVPEVNTRRSASPSDISSNASSSKSGRKGDEKKGKGKPGSGQAVKKADLIRAANTKAKAEKTEDRIAIVWERILDELIDTIENAKTKMEFEESSLMALAKVSDFQKTRLKADSSTHVHLETRFYRLKVLLGLWKEACSGKGKQQRQNLAALILDEAKHIMSSPALSKKTHEAIKKVWVDMGFGAITASTTPDGAEKLSRKLEPGAVRPEMRIETTPIEFQLTHSGPYMDRSFGSAPDSRVKFEPDEWQREVLDLIDANKSVFVVAPTSAGKTFISFYAMEKILRGSDEGVLVYVAPTKALVNQIAAEVLARFNKKYPHAGQTVWAIHTRDYRINKPDQCQILITVPHILQIMLLAPSNACKWAPRVKRIIFDEIHSIGQSEDGVIWEQLLLLAPCPIIALSATVGNPGEFRDWLVETQKAVNYDLKMIEHKYRYSDLRKFIYQPPKDEIFTGLGQKRYFEELDDEPNFTPINPISTLIDIKHRGIPEDINLEPRDCLQLYNAMVKHQTDEYPMNPMLSPARFFKAIVRKAEVVKWEAQLKLQLELWMKKAYSQFEKVMKELSYTKPGMRLSDRAELTAADTSEPSSQTLDDDDAHDNDGDTQNTTLSLLSRLHSKNALPAILFTFDRSMVEKTAITILEQLEEAEREFKKSNPGYLKELEQYKQYKKSESERRVVKPDDKPSLKKTGAKKGKSRDDEVYGIKEARLEEERVETSKWASFDPDAPHEKFLFIGKVNHEVEEDFKALRKASISEIFIKCLRRGIGIHHAGLSRRLREA
ncbi:hypothetical protein ABW19_dt0202301 [Dactylella cylindrospora]|nr:hypothetical protein ABW19_dt0202301 [Dactylella cylindrospora]